jgi:hypothetical protein
MVACGTARLVCEKDVLTSESRRTSDQPKEGEEGGRKEGKKQGRMEEKEEGKKKEEKNEVEGKTRR